MNQFGFGCKMHCKFANKKAETHHLFFFIKKALKKYIVFVDNIWCIKFTYISFFVVSVSRAP